MMRTLGAVLLTLVATLVALILVLGPGALVAFAAAKGELDNALQSFGPLLLLPIGYLVVSLVVVLRRSRDPGTRFSR